MKKMTIKAAVAVFGAVAALALATSAHAVSAGTLIGTIDDGIPSNEDNETSWVQAIVNYHNTSPAGTNPFEAPTVPAGQGPEVIMIYNYDGAGGLPTPVVWGTKYQGEDTDLTQEIGAGYEYGLAKYGLGVSVVYYLGGEGMVFPASPEQGTGGGLSHVSVFNATPDERLPDGGTTAMLLGLAMLGLAAANRKRA
jgi:hypothetical protein